MGGSHSWAVVNRKIAQQAIFSKNKVSITSFNGYNCYTYDPNIYIDKFIGNIDYTISYTNPHNYRSVFNERSKFKIGLCNYESDTLPGDWCLNQRMVDYTVVSSQYSRENFISGGFDRDSVFVVPLGTDVTESDPVFSNGMFNFLNVSSPHSRKNMHQVIRCYYNEFSQRDNVCLTFKTSVPDRLSHFSVNIFDIIRKEQGKRSDDLPMVQVLLDDFEDMSGVYSSCDALISCSSSEGFGLPMLEARCLGKEVICPDYSGQKDFLNFENAHLLKAEEIKAPREHQYWHYNENAMVCQVSDYDVCDTMRSVFNGAKSIKSIDTNKYSWQNCFNSIINIC